MSLPGCLKRCGGPTMLCRSECNVEPAAGCSNAAKGFEGTGAPCRQHSVSEIGAGSRASHMPPGPVGCFHTSSRATMQLRKANQGTESSTQVAIRFIKNGNKVGCSALQSALQHIQMCCCLAGCLTAICCTADFQRTWSGNSCNVNLSLGSSGRSAMLPDKAACTDCCTPTVMLSPPLPGLQQHSRTKQQVYRACLSSRCPPA